MSRIINRQRELAEQGRIRDGYTVPATKRDGTPTTRPTSSKTWVITSHSREHVEHAAQLWGGEAAEWEPMGNGAKQWRVITEASSIPAILPPGDPLSQANEMWSRGGCQRRCNGVTEQFSGSPCICHAQHGEGWFELSREEVCTTKSRLRVLLPDMEGLGSWRMETGSYYASKQLPGFVDTIRGAVGPSVLVPIWLRIKPETRTVNGKTKQFIVPTAELRGVTAGAVLSGQAIESGALLAAAPVNVLEAPADSGGRPALEAGTSSAGVAPDSSVEDPYTQPLELVAAATDHERLVWIWDTARAQHLVGSESEDTPRRAEFVEAWKRRAHEIQDGAAVAPATGAQPDEDGVVDAEIVHDSADGAADPEAAAQAVWEQIVRAGGERGMTLGDIEDDFAQKSGGLSSAQASAAELGAYLAKLEEVPAA